MITSKLLRSASRRTLLLFFLSPIFVHVPAVPQTQPTSPDTVRALSSDTVRVHPIGDLGSIRPNKSGTGFSENLASTKIPWFSYDYLGDLLLLFPGVYIRDLGSPGQHHEINLRGVDRRSIQVFVDGRRMNDPLTGTYHLNFVSPEYVEDIEFVNTVEAAMHGVNGSGGAINVVTKIYDSIKPFTKIRYSEGGFGHLYADGVFAQNIVRRVNLVAGFQRWNLDGRYPNSNYEAWNARFKVRWSPSSRLNLMISEQYNRHTLGMNGGIDYSKTENEDVFNEILARVRNSESYEKLSRHDLTATAGFRLFKDSTSITNLTLYHTSVFREYRDEENRITSNGILVRSDHRSSFSGVSIRQTFNALPFQAQVGGNLDRLQVEGSPNVGRRDEPQSGVFGNLQLLWSNAHVMTFARHDRYLDRDLTAYGVSARLGLISRMSAYGGFSRSERAPTLQEQFWSDSTVIRDENLEPERHTLAQVALQLKFLESLNLEASYSWRKIERPILIRSVLGKYVFPSVDIRNGDERTIQAIDGKFSYRVWKVTLDGSARYLVQEDAGSKVKVLPRWYLTGGVYFRGKIFHDFLDLKAGVRGRYIGRQVGTEFNPETLIYSERTDAEIGPYQTVDVILIGHVGNAYLHLNWENITDEEYMLTPGYPMLGRNVRFGVNWTFLD